MKQNLWGVGSNGVHRKLTGPAVRAAPVHHLPQTMPAIHSPWLYLYKQYWGGPPRSNQVWMRNLWLTQTLRRTGYDTPLHEGTLPWFGLWISLWLNGTCSQHVQGAPVSPALLSHLRTFAQTVPPLKMLLAQHWHGCLDCMHPWPSLLLTSLSPPAISPTLFPSECCHCFSLCVCSGLLSGVQAPWKQQPCLSYSLA